MAKLLYAVVSSFLFIALLVITYKVHIEFFKVNVVFYAAIFDAILSAFLMLMILCLVRQFKVFNGFEKFQLTCIWLLIGYALAISVPTVIDRSLSFYILEKLQQRGGGIRQSSFKEVFTKEYVEEHYLVEVRLTEQLQSGTILIEDGCVKLTKKGDELAKLSRKFRAGWLPKKRLLLGHYSDALTDPFRSASSEVNYICK
jgi:hypothetical protein